MARMQINKRLSIESEIVTPCDDKANEKQKLGACRASSVSAVINTGHCALMASQA